MADAPNRGQFVWHELMTTDTKSAGAFFSKIIGWKTQPWGEDGSYTLFVSGGRQLAGLMALSRPLFPASLPTFSGNQGMNPMFSRSQ